jgi:Flp pilus assembly protein TadG
VEFALVVPLLLLVTFASIQYGFYFLQATGVESVAAQSARALSVGTATQAEVRPEDARA